MARKKDNASATPALKQLTAAGITYELDVHPVSAANSKGFALDSSEVMGVPPECVFKTLMADVDSDHVVAIVPANCSLNLKALAAACGAKHAKMMDRHRAQVLSGYVPGGISPIAQKHPCRVILDESAILQEKIYVSAGKRGWSVLLAPDDLCSVTGASYAAIAVPSSRS